MSESELSFVSNGDWLGGLTTSWRTNAEFAISLTLLNLINRIFRAFRMLLGFTRPWRTNNNAIFVVFDLSVRIIDCFQWLISAMAQGVFTLLALVPMYAAASLD